LGLDPRLALVERFFRGTGSTYDQVVDFATFGIDRLWKRRLVGMIPRDAARICDLACGTGISTFAIARAFPQSRVVGVELREEYLALAREKATRLGMGNVELVLSRAEDYRTNEPFDCVSASYLPKYANLPRLVAGCRAMLRSGGLLLMHDFTFPPGRARIALFRAYFWALQRVGGTLRPQWREIYYGLPKLIEETQWLPELQAALRLSGFGDIRVRHLTLYGSAIVSARK
jgi:demethylmenaquinone methyltransferase / 2-methoxy-6-polyprenyl-1,4-benzoquinol methylase